MRIGGEVMPYYPTIDEDLQRAREILERGKAIYFSPAMQERMREMGVQEGGTIVGADTYAAYKLLESFVAEIERLREKRDAARRVFGKLLDSPDLISELATALDEAMDELDRMKGLLQRYLADHEQRMGIREVWPVPNPCECPLCVETRFTLAGVKVSQPKVDE